MKRAVATALAATAFSGVLAACTSKPGTVTETTVTSTRTRTHSPSTSISIAPATTVAPLPPGAHPPAGEVEKRCPYIASTPEENSAENVADIEGDHVYRTTVLTKHKPVGCRFYFYASAYEAIADIVPRRFATATQARNAMIRTAQAGTQVMGQPDFVPGVDAVLYRTKFYGPDGAQDWACVFAKGRVMVVVHTQRTDTSQAALYLAEALVKKF